MAKALRVKSLLRGKGNGNESQVKTAPMTRLMLPQTSGFTENPFRTPPSITKHVSCAHSAAPYVKICGADVRPSRRPPSCLLNVVSLTSAPLHKTTRSRSEVSETKRPRTTVYITPGRPETRDRGPSCVPLSSHDRPTQQYGT